MKSSIFDHYIPALFFILRCSLVHHTYRYLHQIKQSQPTHLFLFLTCSNNREYSIVENQVLDLWTLLVFVLRDPAVMREEFGVETEEVNR